MRFINYYYCYYASDQLWLPEEWSHIGTLKYVKAMLGYQSLKFVKEIFDLTTIDHIGLRSLYLFLCV